MPDSTSFQWWPAGLLKDLTVSQTYADLLHAVASALDQAGLPIVHDNGDGTAVVYTGCGPGGFYGEPAVMDTAPLPTPPEPTPNPEPTPEPTPTPEPAPAPEPAPEPTPPPEPAPTPEPAP